MIGRLPGRGQARIISRLPGPARARIIISWLPGPATARMAAVAAQPKARIVAVSAVIVTVLASSGAYVLTHGRPAAAAGGARGPAGRPGAAAALQVVSVTPKPGAGQVNGSGPVQITLSAPLAAGSPMPGTQPGRPGQLAIGRPRAGIYSSRAAAALQPRHR